MRGTDGWAHLALAVVLFGGLWPITADAFGRGASPLWFALNRAGLAAAASAVVLALLGRLRLPLPSDLPAIGAIGLLQLGGFFALTHLALTQVPAGRTAILCNVTVFWLVPLSVLILGERVSPRGWAAAALGLLGVAVLILPGLRLGAPLGYALLLGAGLAWSLAIVATRLRPPRRPMLELLPWCFALGALLIGPLALLREPAAGIPGAAWPHAAFVGLAAPIGTWAIVEAGRRLPGVLASLGFLVIPALGLVLSHVWLGEPLGWDVVAGGALIVASVVVAARG